MILNDEALPNPSGKRNEATKLGKRKAFINLNSEEICPRKKLLASSYPLMYLENCQHNLNQVTGLNPVYENASLAQTPSRCQERMEIYEEREIHSPAEFADDEIVRKLSGKKFSLIDEKLINKSIIKNINSLDPLIKRILEKQHEK